MLFWLAHFTNLAVSNCSLDSPGAENCETNLPQVNADAHTLQLILQILFGVIGFVAVIMIIIAGFQLVISQGDSQAIAKARQTIIYAAIGLVVVFSAETIVTVVLGRL